MTFAYSRRRFLQSTSYAAAPLLLPASAFGAEANPAPSERITVGIVGLGSRGFNLLDELVGMLDVQIVSLCDVHDLHYRDRPWEKGKAYGLQAAKAAVSDAYTAGKRGDAVKGIQTTNDFREVCGRDDIDAVVIATPDHWHALCTLEALRAGKDVYCEKPITHTFAEGEAVVAEVAKQKAIFQTGSQQRSDRLFHRAAELVRNGHLGQVRRVEVGLPPGYDLPQGDDTLETPPKGLDYEMWTGPAPMLPYMRARHHRWWRGHRAYGGGVLMDWIGHHNDIAHWALGLDRGGPERVEAVGWTAPKTDIYNTPAQYEIRCRYAGGIESTISSRHKLGLKIEGDAGWLFVTRGKLTTSDPQWTATDFNPGEIKLYDSLGHMRNFVEGVKSRQECIAPAETAHCSITPGHLGYVSHALGRAINWNSGDRQVVNDREADDLLRAMSYRNPWEFK